MRVGALNRRSSAHLFSGRFHPIFDDEPKEIGHIAPLRCSRAPKRAVQAISYPKRHSPRHSVPAPWATAFFIVSHKITLTDFRGGRKIWRSTIVEIT